MTPARPGCCGGAFAESADCGEQRLLIAILEDAVECFRKHALARGRRGQQLFREVEQWLMSDNEEPFTFAHICAVLDIDPAYLRGGLRRWRQQQSAPPDVATCQCCAPGETPQGRQRSA